MLSVQHDYLHGLLPGCLLADPHVANTAMRVWMQCMQTVLNLISAPHGHEAVRVLPGGSQWHSIALQTAALYLAYFVRRVFGDCCAQH